MMHRSIEFLLFWGVMLNALGAVAAAERPRSWRRSLLHTGAAVALYALMVAHAAGALWAR